MKQWIRLLIASAKQWNADNAIKHSAAVSFYTLFSLAPITVIAVGIAGFFWGRDEANEQFHAQMIGLIGKELHPLSHLVQTMRKTVQTAQYLQTLGPFFIGHVVWQSTARI